MLPMVLPVRANNLFRSKGTDQVYRLTVSEVLQGNSLAGSHTWSFIEASAMFWSPLKYSGLLTNARSAMRRLNRSNFSLRIACASPPQRQVNQLAKCKGSTPCVNKQLLNISVLRNPKS